MESEISGDTDDGVSVRYFLPAPALRPFVSTYSLTTVAADSPTIFDQVYPEWPNIRFSPGGRMAACTGPGPLVDCGAICGIGPTRHATHFSLEAGRYWTVSLLPSGWARFLDIPASRFADRWEVVDGDGAFARFLPLLECAIRAEDAGKAVAAFDDLLTGLLGEERRAEASIAAAHAALLDPAVSTVAALAESIGLSVRALERLADGAFGFGPKLLLRRQRFLRSLSQFMLDPSLAWIDTLDTQYVDQAHFIRDFRRFMDTTPRAYAALPHPVLWAAAAARQAAAGSAMQVLQRPAGIAKRSPRH